MAKLLRPASKGMELVDVFSNTAVKTIQMLIQSRQLLTTQSSLC